MDDERTLLELDDRLREAFTTDDAGVRRIVQRALADDPARGGRVPILRYGLFAAAMLLALAAGAQRWRYEPVGAARPALSLVGRSSTIIVDSADGRRWVLEAAPERRASGNYVIVLAE